MRKVDYGDKIMDVLCDEKDGDITRSVYKMPLSPSNVQIFWQQAKRHRTLFNEEIRDNYAKFLGLLLKTNGNTQVVSPNGLFFLVDDFIGIFYATDIKPGIDSVVHYTFFDGKHHGRINLCLAMLEYWFNEYGFQRLTVELPMYATQRTHNFVAKSLGFKREGRKRKARWFDGEYFDVMLYGMLREELNEHGDARRNDWRRAD